MSSKKQPLKIQNVDFSPEVPYPKLLKMRHSSEKGEMKKKRILLGFLLLTAVSTFGIQNRAASLPPGKGGVLPSINLPLPKESFERDYLGLSGQGFFKVPQIKTRVVIIEIFSLYCPPCVKLGPKVKELYQRIESNPELNGKIKLIGIGAGNTVNEVQHFQRITEAPFPLFPDSDFHIHEALGEVRTPYFIGIKIHDDRTHEVIYSELGGFTNVQEFLDFLITASELK